MDTPEQQLENSRTIARISEDVRRLKQDLAIKQKSHELEIEAYKARKLILQKQCPHIFKHHRDPSGNNDSCDICIVCDFER